MPTAWAAIPMRPPSSVAIATTKPLRSSWSIRSPSTRALSRRRSAVEDECSPSFSSSRVTSTCSASSRKAETPRAPSVSGSVRAKRRNVEAWLPFVHHCFVPLIRQALSPSRTAVVRSEPASDPAPGSVRANAPMTSPREWWDEPRFLLIGAERDDRKRRRAGVDGNGHANSRVGARELLQDEDVRHEVCPGAAELLRDADAHQPDFTELPEELPRE